VEARAVNICQAISSLEYTKDLEKDKILCQTCKIKYEQGDKLFITKLLLESTVVDLCTISMIVRG